MSLKLQGLTVNFGNRMAVSSMDLEFTRGMVTLILGPNGSGKSTLLRAIAGIPLDRPGKNGVSGVISLDGCDLRGLKTVERASRVSYIGSELISEFPITVRETVELGSYVQGGGAENSRDALERTDCLVLADRKVGELSGGERQRVALARAIVQNAVVWLLDESLSKMDIDQQFKFARLLRQEASDRKRVIVFVSHDYANSLDWGDHCLLIKDGMKVAHGALRETVTTENMAKLYPDAGIRVQVDAETGRLSLGQK